MNYFYVVYCPYKKFRTQINTCKSLCIHTKLKSLKVYGSFPEKQQFVSNVCEKVNNPTIFLPETLYMMT